MSRCIVCGRLCDAQDNDGEDIGIELQTTAGVVCSEECKTRALESGDF